VVAQSIEGAKVVSGVLKPFGDKLFARSVNEHMDFVGTARNRNIRRLVDCSNRPAGEVQHFPGGLKSACRSADGRVHRHICLEHMKPSGPTRHRGFHERFSGLLAAVALQHVHRIDGYVIAADSVLVHLRLLKVVFRLASTLYSTTDSVVITQDMGFYGVSRRRWISESRVRVGEPREAGRARPRLREIHWGTIRIAGLSGVS